MLRIFRRVAMRHDTKGEQGQSLTVYEINWELFRELRECRHPDIYFAESELWEVPETVQQIAGWLSGGMDFFLLPDDDPEPTVDDDDLMAWTV